MDVGDHPGHHFLEPGTADLGRPVPGRTPIERGNGGGGMDAGGHGVGAFRRRGALRAGQIPGQIAGDDPGLFGFGVEGANGVVKADGHVRNVEADIGRRRQAFQVTSKFITQIADGTALKRRQVGVIPASKLF